MGEERKRERGRERERERERRKKEGKANTRGIENGDIFVIIENKPSRRVTVREFCLCLRGWIPRFDSVAYGRGNVIVPEQELHGRLVYERWQRQ
ncbi:hypothetical protein WN48_05031 [Eufriesea mexicana]|nr:hypothetical protein WN48_05031 [Eufriesea mexicana]